MARSLCHLAASPPLQLFSDRSPWEEAVEGSWQAAQCNTPCHQSMDDEAVKAEIRGWESGRHVYERKDEWFIGLLAMSPQQPLPTGSYMRKAAKKEKHPSGTESEPRTKVSS